MQAMLVDPKASAMKHILVDPAPLIASTRAERAPGYNAHANLIAANQKLYKNAAGKMLAEPLPLWGALDCYYEGKSTAALTELKAWNGTGEKVDPRENRHTSVCGAFVHSYALMALMKKSDAFPSLLGNPELLAAQIGQRCPLQDLDSLKSCVENPSAAPKPGEGAGGGGGPTGPVKVKLALVGDSICDPGVVDDKHMGWCNVLTTVGDSKHSVPGVWAEDTPVRDIGVAGQYAASFHNCWVPGKNLWGGADLDICWKNVIKDNAEIVLWGLGENDQICSYICKDGEQPSYDASGKATCPGNEYEWPGLSGQECIEKE